MRKTMKMMTYTQAVVFALADGSEGHLLATSPATLQTASGSAASPRLSSITHSKSCGGGKDSGASMAASSPMADPFEGKTQEYMLRLNLGAIMLGQAYKTNLRWAWDLYDKCDNQSTLGKKLKQHLKFVECATHLVYNRIEAADFTDLKGHVKELKEASLEFPTEIKLALLHKFLTENTRDKKSALQNIVELTMMVCPIRLKVLGEIAAGGAGGADKANEKTVDEASGEDRPGHEFAGDDAGFDPEFPRLCDIEGSPAELAQQFLENMKTIVLPTFASVASIDLELAKRAYETFESMLNDVGFDIEASYINVFTKALTIIRALLCCADPSDIDHVQDVNTVKTQERTKSTDDLTEVLLIEIRNNAKFKEA